MSRLLSTFALVATLGASIALPGVQPAAAAEYGCYKVIGASSINIRAKAYSKAEVIGVANRGEVLIKWKRWCALRGFWCPVQKGNVVGHADKRYLMQVQCPE